MFTLVTGTIIECADTSLDKSIAFLYIIRRDMKIRKKHFRRAAASSIIFYMRMK